MTGSMRSTFLTHMLLPMLCNASMWLEWPVLVTVSSKCAARCLMKCYSRCRITTTCLHLVPYVSSLHRTRWSLSNFVYFTPCCVPWAQSRPAFQWVRRSCLIFTLPWREGREGGHCCSIASCIGYFELLCALLYLPTTALCLPFYTTPCIARLLSGRYISTVRSYP